LSATLTSLSKQFESVETAMADGSADATTLRFAAHVAERITSNAQISVH
jgi:hypothetical protein